MEGSFEETIDNFLRDSRKILAKCPRKRKKISRKLFSWEGSYEHIEYTFDNCD